MLTTTIGAYPRPDCVPFKDRSGAEPGTDAPEPAVGYAEAVATYGEERLKALLDRATAEVVQEQDELGIDVPAEGEVRRDDSVLCLCRRLRGIDFDRLTGTRGEGDDGRPLPTVIGPIQAGPPFLPDDWRAAQAATKKPVKMSLRGPMTIGDGLADAFYEGDERRRSGDIADALNREIRALADAGCRHIEIDEPVLALRPEEALAFAIEHLERCFHRVPKEVARIVRIGRGRPSALDAEDDPEAPEDAYLTLADALEDAAIDAIALEDARRPNDLGLLERFARTTLILGVIDVARSRVEEPEEVRDRLRAALEHIDPHRLLAAPDGGLRLLGRELARRKLCVLVDAVRRL